MTKSFVQDIILLKQPHLNDDIRGYTVSQKFIQSSSYFKQPLATYKNGRLGFAMFETQGCHYLLDVKFKDFSMTFQDLFKQIQDLLYQLKAERFTHVFQNKL